MPPYRSRSVSRSKSPLKRAISTLEKSSETTVDLWCDDNVFSDTSAIRLAVALRANCTIQRLHLSRNRIRNEGAVVLARVFREHSTITWVDLSDNFIRDRGALALLRAVEGNRCITYMDLAGNDLPLTIFGLLDSAVDQNAAGTRVFTISLNLPQPTDFRYCSIAFKNLAGVVELNVAVQWIMPIGFLRRHVSRLLSHAGHVEFVLADGTLLTDHMQVDLLFALVSTFEKALENRTPDTITIDLFL